MTSLVKKHSFQNAFFLLLFILYILAGTPLVPLHGDETTQIYMGRDFYYQVIQRDLTRIVYSETPEALSESAATEQHLRLLNGTLPKYLFGLAAYLGGYEINQLNEQWDWCCDWQYNFDNGHIPSADLLLRARWVSSLFLAAGVIVMFWIGQAAVSRPVAYVASLYYALNPVLLLNGRRAMMEGGLIFFSLLVLWAGIWLIKSEKSSLKFWMAIVFLGIVSGLAVASKHTAALGVTVVFVGYFIFNVHILRRESTKDFFVSIIKNSLRLFFVGLITLGIFYALNPAWWGDPIGRIGTVLSLRTELLGGQTQFFGGYADFADRSAGFFRQVFIALPQYYEVANWQNFIGDQMTTYETAFLQGISIGGTVVGGIVLFILMIAGMIFVWRDKTILPGVRGVLFVYSIALPGLILLLTPLEWQRYYVPVYPAVGLMAAIGLVGLIKIGQQAWQKHRKI
jgi:4-amino-4-deoxy-L-arabinose transferase-like glycosyltransferase